MATAGTTHEPGVIPLAVLPYIFGISVDQSDPNYLFLATRGGVYRTAPDGASVRVSASKSAFSNVVSHPSFASVLYAVGPLEDGLNPILITSSNSGVGWRSLLQSGPQPYYPRAIDVSKRDASTIYAFNNRMWVSRDAGATWLRTGSAPAQVLDIAASSIDVNTVYAATDSGIFISKDSGQSWDRASDKLCGQPVTVIETGTNGIVYAFSLCEGLLRSDEITGEWVVVNDNFGGCIIQHLAVDPSNSQRLFAVERCHRVWASEDGGRNWQVHGSNNALMPRCVTDSSGRTIPDD